MDGGGGVVEFIIYINMGISTATSGTAAGVGGKWRIGEGVVELR